MRSPALKMKRIGVVGATGRTGAQVVQLLKSHPRCRLAAAVVSAQSAQLGALLDGDGGEQVVAQSDYAGLVQCDGVIDFSTPAASCAVAAVCAERGIPLLVATTGHSTEQRAALEQYAQRLPLCCAPNTSIGATVLALAAEFVQGLLGPTFDVEVLEVHHRMKRDAPSGTARMIVQRIQDGAAERDGTAAPMVFGREGVRQPGEIGVVALRGGDVVGDHTVYFLGAGERIELTHQAHSRAVFALGAVTLIERLIERSAGLYSVRELLIGSHAGGGAA